MSKRSYETAFARENVSTRQDLYEKNFPNFREPSAIGAFSVDRNRQFHPDLHQIKFCNLRDVPEVMKSVHLDLNNGMDKVIRKDEEACKEERLQHLLNGILNNLDRFRTSESSPMDSLNTDFVCFRGCLTTIMCSPYEKREGWLVTAVKWRNTIYLHKEETIEQTRQRRNASARQKCMASWGYKFEQFLSEDSPNSLSPPVLKRNSSEKMPAVIEPEEFCCIYRSRLGAHSLVYGAEMDAVENSEYVQAMFNKGKMQSLNLNKLDFMEFKTSRALTDNRKEESFKKFKMIKWWAQSFLVGIGTIVCGFRDDDGFVTSLVKYSVKDLPKPCKTFWKPNVMMNFLSKFLEHVKQVMAQQADLSHVQFTFIPQQREVVSSTTDFMPDYILPMFYRDKMFSKA